MNREFYKQIAESSENDEYLLDLIRKIFVTGVESSFHKRHREEVVDQANDVWEKELKKQVIKMFGLT